MKRLVMLLSALGMSGACLAAGGAPGRIALLIGNWDYNANGRYDETAEAGLQPDLRYPCEQVDKLQAALKRIAFDAIDVACNLEKKAFDQRVNAFVEKVKALPKGSVVFIYYSGHGAQQFGYVYSLPVLFRLQHQQHTAVANDQIRHLSSQAVNVQSMLEKFPAGREVAIYVALDQCRTEAVLKRDAYNDMVNIKTAENVMVQYSATPGEFSPDNEDFSSLLASELLKGGDLGRVAARVYGKSLEQFRAGKSATYATAHAGHYFATFNSPAMLIKAAPETPLPAHPAPPAAGAVQRTKRMFRNVYDNPSLDILWCEGEGEAERYAAAVDLAETLAKDARRYGVGRVMVKPLAVKTNLHDGYNVRRNLMRFDPDERQERALLENISVQFSALALLPQRGVGVGGKPTRNYVSAFICEGFTGR